MKPLQPRSGIKCRRADCKEWNPEKQLCGIEIAADAPAGFFDELCPANPAKPYQPDIKHPADYRLHLEDGTSFPISGEESISTLCPGCGTRHTCASSLQELAEMMCGRGMASGQGIDLMDTHFYCDVCTEQRRLAE